MLLDFPAGDNWPVPAPVDIAKPLPSMVETMAIAVLRGTCWALIAGFLLFGLVTMVGNLFPEPRIWWADGIEMPPARFDHWPRAKVFVRHIHFNQMQFVCGLTAAERAQKMSVLACAPMFGNECWLFLPVWAEFEGGNNSAWRRHIWKHERAHCNGWRHPDHL
jgi:hypothetical protein